MASVQESPHLGEHGQQAQPTAAHNRGGMGLVSGTAVAGRVRMSPVTDALDGLDAARRAGWARAFDAEEVAAHMLYTLYLTGVLADGFVDLERKAGKLVRDWLNGAVMEPVG